MKYNLTLLCFGYLRFVLPSFGMQTCWLSANAITPKGLSKRPSDLCSAKVKRFIPEFLSKETTREWMSLETWIYLWWESP